MGEPAPLELDLAPAVAAPPEPDPLLFSPGWSAVASGMSRLASLAFRAGMTLPAVLLALRILKELPSVPSMLAAGVYVFAFAFLLFASVELLRITWKLGASPDPWGKMWVFSGAGATAVAAALALVEAASARMNRIELPEWLGWEAVGLGQVLSFGGVLAVLGALCAAAYVVRTGRLLGWSWPRLARYLAFAVGPALLLVGLWLDRPAGFGLFLPLVGFGLYAASIWWTFVLLKDLAAEIRLMAVVRAAAP